MEKELIIHRCNNKVMYTVYNELYHQDVYVIFNTMFGTIQTLYNEELAKQELLRG